MNVALKFSYILIGFSYSFLLLNKIYFGISLLLGILLMMTLSRPNKIYFHFSNTKINYTFFILMLSLDYIDKIRRFKFFKNSSNFANSFSTFLILPLFIAPSFLALIFYNDITNATLAFFILSALYVFAYYRIKASF